jgi:hypothetical protein
MGYSVTHKGHKIMIFYVLNTKEIKMWLSRGKLHKYVAPIKVASVEEK